MRNRSGHAGRMRRSCRRAGRPCASGGAYAAGDLSSSRGPPLPSRRHTQVGTTTTDPASLAKLITLARYGGGRGPPAPRARPPAPPGAAGGGTDPPPARGPPPPAPRPPPLPRGPPTEG